MKDDKEMETRYLTLQEVATMLRLSYRTIKRHHASGLLKTTRLSPGKLGVTQHQLQDYLAALRG